MARKTLRQELEELKPELAAAAQKVYDDWNQDAEGVDEVYGAGGICDDIAESIGSAVAEKIDDVELGNGGQDGDDHAWVVATRGGESYGIDIPCSIYERGGGYKWRKVQGVAFQPDHIQIFEMGGPTMGVNEGGTNIQGNRFEADVSRNKKNADLKDRKISRVLHTLNREDVQELHDICAELLDFMPEVE